MGKRRPPLFLLATLAIAGCARFERTANSDAELIQLVAFEQPAAKSVYVVGHGWHTGLVLRASDIPPEVFPEIRDFTDCEFVEIGWGDEGFYRAKKITAPLVCQALFWPTRSVLHVAGFSGPVAQFFQAGDLVRVELTDEEFVNLCQFVSDTFDRTEHGESNRLGPGIYGDSKFYRANGKYYFPKTCNIWTAKALKRADCRITPQIAVTADNVLSQTRKFGEVLQKSPRGVKKAALRGADE